MDRQAKKLAHVYELSDEDAQAMVEAGFDTPRKARAGADKSSLPKRIKDKVKARDV